MTCRHYLKMHQHVTLVPYAGQCIISHYFKCLSTCILIKILDELFIVFIFGRTPSIYNHLYLTSYKQNVNMQLLQMLYYST